MTINKLKQSVAGRGLVQRRQLLQVRDVVSLLELFGRSFRQVVEESEWLLRLFALLGLPRGH